MIGRLLPGLAAAFCLFAAAAAAQTGDIRDPAVKRALAQRFGTQFEDALKAYDAGEYATAFNLWLEIAREGDIAAQRNVAHMLRKGIGTDRDLPRALEFYKRAAKAGLVGAQLNLASMYLAGEGTDRDPARAAAWYARAARAGDPLAQYSLAKMIEEGDGIDRDPEKALALYRIAAEGGSEKAAERVAALATRQTAPAPQASLAPKPPTTEAVLPGTAPSAANPARSHLLEALYGGTRTPQADPSLAEAMPQTEPRADGP